MKNKLILQLLVFFAAVLIFNGCARITGKPSSGEGTRADSIEPELSQPTGPYYYLKSRMHLRAGDLPEAEIALKNAIAHDPGSSFLKRDLIRVYHEQQKTDQALALAQELVISDSKDVDNLLLLVRLKKDTASEAELTGLLNQILELDPGNKETYLRLGKIYMENKEDQKALDLFSRMVEAFPDYYVAHFYLGEAALLNKKDSMAKTAFLRTIELEPELVEPRFKLIDIYKRQGAKDGRQKILEAYEHILQIEPGNDRAVLEMALFYYKNKQMKKADYLFSQLGQEAVKNPRLVMTAVDTYLSEKRYEDGAIVFSQLLKTNPESADLNFFAGMAWEAMEKFDRAIAHYRKVTPEHAQYKKTLLTIAFLYRDMDKTPKAVQFLEQQHEKMPGDIDIISYLASFYEEEKRLDDAMALLEKGLAKNPDNTTLLFRLGTIQDKAGLKAECMETMKRVILLEPDNSSALNYLGYTYAELGIKLEKARQLIERAMALKPNDGYITDSMGWVHYQLGDYEKAVFYLEQAAELSDFETIISAHLADAYVKTGDLKKALAAYEKALANANEDQADQILEIKEKIKALEKQFNEAP